MSSLPTASRTRPARRRVLTATALTAVAALALSGCMKVDMDLTVTEEDTVSGTSVMAFSDEFARGIGMDPQDLWDAMEAEEDGPTSELPEGGTEKGYADGEYTGVEMTYPEQSLEEMNEFLEEWTITREGDEFVIDGVFDLTDESGELGEPGDETLDEMLATFDVRFAVTFPGEVVESTGEIDGNTVVWNPQIGEVTEMHARASAVAGGTVAEETETEAVADDAAASSDEDTVAIADDVEEVAVEEAAGGFPWWAVGLVVGLAVLGTVAALVVRHNRRSGPPATGAPGAGEPPHTDGPVPPDYGQPQQPASPVVPPRQDP